MISRMSIFFALIGQFTVTLHLSAQPCIDFVTPVTGSVITEPLCTLLIEVNDCPRSIKKIEFQARYFPAGSDTAAVLSIGSVSRQPYTIVWDISMIPNQLFSGASFFAEATLSNGDLKAVRREGVFFLHKKVERPVFKAPYEFSGVERISGESIHLPASRPDVTINASIYWNEKELIIITEVSDPQFDCKLSNERLASIGIEILLDPALSRKPFPGKDVFIYSVSLAGKPYRIVYKPVPDDSGAFKFETSTLVCDFSANIQKESRRGFTIYCPVPMAIFGQKIPESIGLNLVAKTLSEKNEVKRTSWVKASLYETYSPFLWGEVRLQPRPLLMNRLLVGAISFGIGFVVVLLISMAADFLGKPSVKNVGLQSDEDRRQFAAIKELLDVNVIAPNVTLDGVAKTLNLQPKTLSRLLRRTTGMNFHTYVMYTRLELAKERLRSSHCTEESIAKTCGFHSVAEMEKYFVKFYRTTPARFRTEQQVV